MHRHYLVQPYTIAKGGREVKSLSFFYRYLVIGDSGDLQCHDAVFESAYKMRCIFSGQALVLRYAIAGIHWMPASPTIISTTATGSAANAFHAPKRDFVCFIIVMRFLMLILLKLLVIWPYPNPVVCL